jgi:hypothetical protein
MTNKWFPAENVNLLLRKRGIKGNFYLSGKENPSQSPFMKGRGLFA